MINANVAAKTPFEMGAGAQINIHRKLVGSDMINSGDAAKTPFEMDAGARGNIQRRLVG